MGTQYLVDTASSQQLTGRKNFDGVSSLQRYHQEAVKTLNIVNRTTVAEPGSPTNGQIYLIAPSGAVTGAAWAAAPLSLANNDLVARSENVWVKITPFDGLEIFDLSTGLRLERYGGAWRDAGGGLGGAPIVTEADLANAAQAINTTGKYDGRIVKVENLAPGLSGIFRRWVAQGPAPTDPWVPVDDQSGGTLIIPA